MESSNIPGGDPPTALPNGADHPALVKGFLGVKVDKLHAELQAKLEAKSEELREAILKCSPTGLLGFLWSQLALSQMLSAEAEADDETGDREGESENSAHLGLDDLMFAMEYVHAVLSSHPAERHGRSTADADVNAVAALAEDLRGQALMYCLIAAKRLPDDVFGPDTGEVAMQAMTTWVTVRGHRYQALEREFFEFVFEPHDTAIREAYGIGAREVARGIQAAVDSTRFGHANAATALQQEIQVVADLAKDKGFGLEEALEEMYGKREQRTLKSSEALTAMFFGGVCNLSKTSGLPAQLLEDLSYKPGEETDFFSEGPLKGTPLRRMPGRVRPLVALEDGCYTCDANFIRDSAYRAVQWGLTKRLPKYKQEWLDRQTLLSESAFQRVFAKQLAGAEVYTSVYYPHPDTGAWVENDVLILFDDVLLQVEAKAGVMAMHSPELFFDKQARAIRDLVIKAYQQCSRFLQYAASAEEVPLYRLVGGKYEEIRRLRLSAYRQVFPIGLTVEAFTPFSAMCKRLPDVQSILGKHPFISMSIDDLFVLKRLLPTAGELMHYLTVRQGIGGMREVMLYDELDHLGAYVFKNRADLTFADQLKKEGATLLIYSEGSQLVDEYFGDPDWSQKEPPKQNFPALLADFLSANDKVRGRRFLDADATIRDMSGAGRENLAVQLEKLLPTLRKYPLRWIMLKFEEPLLIWLQQAGLDARDKRRAKAEAAALCVDSPGCKVLTIDFKANKTFGGGSTYYVRAPKKGDPAYAERVADAKRMEARAFDLPDSGT